MANTLLSVIVSDAYRESNITNINTVLTDAQMAEGLRKLQRVIDSVYGNEAGENLQSYPIGRVDVHTPGDYPPVRYDDQWIPLNVRSAINLDEPKTIYLHPDPQDGSRFAVVDENSTTLALTIDANGRRIGASNTFLFNIPQGHMQWMYDAVTGTWNVVTPLADTDPMPFPPAFDDTFILMLAMRVNPSYTTTMAPESLQALKDNIRKFKARYHQSIPQASELALILTPNIRRERGYYGYGYGSTTDVWNSGYPYGGFF